MDIRVPQEVSLVGFDDAWAAEYLDPPLTTVLFPYREIIDRALEFLLNRMAGTARGPQQLVLPGTLIVRGSTAPPAKENYPRAKLGGHEVHAADVRGTGRIDIVSKTWATVERRGGKMHLDFLENVAG